jgi:hypothetical protein
MSWQRQISSFYIRNKKKLLLCERFLQSRSVCTAIFSRMYLVLTTHSWFTSFLGSLNKWETHKTFIDIHFRRRTLDVRNIFRCISNCCCFFGRPLSWLFLSLFHPNSHVLLFRMTLRNSRKKKLFGCHWKF